MNLAANTEGTSVSTPFTMNIDQEDEVKHMLARQFYLHFHKHRKSHWRAAPFVTEWAQDYADIACSYLLGDESDLDEVIALLREDYK